MSIKKIKYIVIITIGAILIGFTLNRCLKVASKKLVDDSNVIETTSENQLIADRKKTYEQDEFYYDKIIKQYANGENIINLPLSSKFMNKFKDGIISEKKEKYYISYADLVECHDKANNIMTLTVVDRNGPKSKDVRIHYTYNDKYELDDLEILEEKLILDEHGNVVIEDTIHTEPLDVAKFVLFKNTIHDVLKVTENFAKKYPNYSTKPIFDNFSIISTIRDFDEFKRKLAYDDIKNYVSLDKNEFLLEMLNSDSTIYYKIKMYIKDGILDDMDILLVKEYPAVEDLNEFR